MNYRKALEKEPELVQGHFNLGNALHKQGKYEDAVTAVRAGDRPGDGRRDEGVRHYNIGNSFLKEQKYQDAVQSYIEALKLNPDDEDAKYNLSYALEMLKQQQQQQQQQNKDKNQKKQDNKNQQQDQQQQQQKQDQQQPKDKQPQPQPRRSSGRCRRRRRERILDVLKNNEKDVQKKLRVRQAVRPRGDKDW